MGFYFERFEWPNLGVSSVTRKPFLFQFYGERDDGGEDKSLKRGEIVTGEALIAYTALLRATRKLFPGDTEMLKASPSEIRKKFEENRHVATESDYLAFSKRGESKSGICRSYFGASIRGDA